MAVYKTPGVYVEEISTLPPSVAEVSTAVPAFIGYTEKGSGQVKRINTLLEYESTFGKAKPSTFAVTTTTNATGVVVLDSIEKNAETTFLMYYCLSHYFKNGGGSCYIISIGDYSAPPAKADFDAGLKELEKEDEPTIILLTDAVNLNTPDYYSLCQDVLAQCNKLGDRFGVFDVLNNDTDGADFRNGIGTNYLMYGAAYYPFLNTTLNYHFEESGVEINMGGSESAWSKAFGENGILVNYTGNDGDSPEVKIVATGTEVTFNTDSQLLTISGVSGQNGNAVVAAWDTWKSGNDAAGFDIVVNGDGNQEVQHTSNSNVPLDAIPTATLSSIKTTNTTLYNQVKASLAQQRVKLPPSPAIAGVYASVDRNRGVWKAPANVSLSSVIGPTAKITHEDQERLNVDPEAGKSINAIRAFAGKGTLVWGARTLAGNDNEWRYVSVRRLFNTIEESTKKATAFAVFESNDATTWLKVKAMIESYLYGLWEQGALMGSTPEAAYFVNVGLGKTMTPQDVLEGRMIVEMGIAAVRPAEFIILRFMHKLPEA